LSKGLAVNSGWPLLWRIVSAFGAIGLGVTLVALVLLAYASISHLRRPEKKIPWHWGTGIVWLSIRLFLCGIVLQAISFTGRIALGGS
jgi:hypothetical protein